MKNKIRNRIGLLGIATVIGLTCLTGCANYSAAPLSALSGDFIQHAGSTSGDVVAASKMFSSADCDKYLDRNVIDHGYQPVQLYIQNNSDRSYNFSLNRISFTCASAEEVAEKVHTSTVGRAVGYGVGSLFLWPLAIPAVVDGVKSSKANKALDRDFASKVDRDQVIFPHSKLNVLLFVPVEEFRSDFTLTLMENNTNKPKTLNLTVY